jgi:NAD(P)-dependent dehydrogenase (short-subunit alcohol dehydrogenase family)
VKSVVITGVSSGIGLALAKILSGSGWKVFGSVRDSACGQRLKEELGPNFEPLEFDVTDEDAVSRAAAHVGRKLSGARLNALVNNAGVVLAGPLAHQPTADFRGQIETNLVGPFIVTKAFLPLLGTDPHLVGPPGRVVNVSSMAGRYGVPLMGGYCASKHGLEGYTESLRREISIYGINVVLFTPGSVATAVFNRSERLVDSYGGTDYKSSLRDFLQSMQESVRNGHTPEQIAIHLAQVLNARRPKLHYVVVWRALLYWYLPKLMTRRFMDRKMIAAYGLQPRRGVTEQ